MIGLKRFGWKAATRAIPAKAHFVRGLPVQARCSERRFVLDLPFVDHAAKVPEEPISIDAARRIDGHMWHARACRSKYQVDGVVDLGGGENFSKPVIRNFAG